MAISIATGMKIFSTIANDPSTSAKIDRSIQSKDGKRALLHGIIPITRKTAQKKRAAAYASTLRLPTSVKTCASSTKRRALSASRVPSTTNAAAHKAVTMPTKPSAAVSTASPPDPCLRCCIVLFCRARGRCYSTISMLLTIASSIGRSSESVGNCSIASTTLIPLVTIPKIVCLPRSHGARDAVRMKN